MSSTLLEEDGDAKLFQWDNVCDDYLHELVDRASSHTLHCSAHDEPCKCLGGAAESRCELNKDG